MRKSWVAITHGGTWGNSIFVFLLAITVRIACIFFLHPYLDLARFELERTALSLAHTGVYGNPYAIPTGPTAHVSPGYTVMLAALFRLFGDGTSGEIVKELLASVVSAIGCALILPVASAFRLSRAVGLISGIIFALVPLKPLVQIDGDWEAPYTAIFIALLCISTVRQWRTHDLLLSHAAGRGLLWGLALLFSSVLLPILPVLLVAGLYVFRNAGLKRYGVAACLELAIALLCLVPWVVRNEAALRSPVATRSNLGIELRVSNNDEATPDQRVNYNRGVYHRFHPLQNVGEALKVKQLGEIKYNRLAMRDTKAWIAAHPQRFAELTIGRFADFWFYPDPSRVKALLGDLTAILGLTGLVLVWRHCWQAGLASSLILLFYSAPSYLVHVGARQRYPIDWLLTLLSVYAVSRLWDASGSRIARNAVLRQTP